jgi:hypothetical protein
VQKILAIVLVIGGLVGCSSSSQNQDAVVKPFVFADKQAVIVGKAAASGDSQLPTIGTVFTFDNPPEVMTVASLGSESFVLKKSDGNFATFSDIGWLPPTQWGGGVSNTSSGRRIIDAAPSNPSGELKVGNNYSFRITTLNDRPASTERNLWECEVTQAGEIEVAAGKTDSFELLCKEDGIEKVLVNYSPSLKFFVRHVLITPQGPVVRQLTRYRKGT